MNEAAAVAAARRRLRVAGVVQGVGFRPFVARLAAELELAGLVGNDAGGVFIEIEGAAARLDRFAERLVAERPALALIESVHATSIPPAGERTFTIVESDAADGLRTLLPPDVATCEDCLADIGDPADRRFRYPFTNCTNCGPRFTIVRDLPYDRASTTMAGFAMCPACAAEYADPTDRRYHAQPVACPACGPEVAWERTGHDVVTGTDAVITAAHAALARGDVVAVKGLGGYHLACDATDADAVDRLRRRKGRGDKPFAVMVPTPEVAEELAELSPIEREALTSPARPIVLVRRRRGTWLADGVAPGNPLVGVMLPYTPLHHLLLRPVPGVATTVPRALVLTSGNRSDEPICFDDAEARTRLADLADAFVVHDRPIRVPCDDSVVRVIDGVIQPVRRSRGYAPLPVALPVDVAPVVGTGGELKNTCCVAAGRHAWVGQHVGDMENLETLRAFSASMDAFTRMYRVEPVAFGADLHPGYLTSRWAATHHGGSVIGVQHHHAHVAAVMAEHGCDGTTGVLGFAFDGTGYGLDAAGQVQIWGGEVLLADYERYERVAHLRPLPLPGGDGAVRNPCRIAVAALAALGLPVEPWIPAVAACDEIELGVVLRQVERNVGCVPSTSMGRLFDAVASLLGVRHRVDYEAQAAMELEWLAADGRPDAVRLAFGVRDDGRIDPAPVLAGVLAGLRDRVPTADLALAVHQAIADMVAVVAEWLRAERSIDGPVALTGGVFQNALLTALTRQRLVEEGFTVLTHRLVPPNDGGLSLGQAVIAGVAAARSSRRL